MSDVTRPVNPGGTGGTGGDRAAVGAALRAAFGDVRPTRDPVLAARLAGTRRRRRRVGVRWVTVALVATAAAAALLLALPAGALDRHRGPEGVPMGWVWLTGAGLLAIAEVLSLDLVLLTCGIGAALAAAAAAVGAPLAAQVVVFLLGSALLLAVARPAVRRRLEASAPVRHTGVAALVGQEAVVVRAVDASGGRVRLSGEEWSAQALDGTPPLPVGTRVRVVEIRGATAVVADL